MKQSYNWKPKGKYGNRKVELDGHKFDSVKESRVYSMLKVRQMAGEISDLKLQVSYELNGGGTFSYKYVADFTYIESGTLIVADAKGFKTVEYRKKKKIMQKVHNITIKEF
jgi:hypothetical protein